MENDTISKKKKKKLKLKPFLGAAALLGVIAGSTAAYKTGLMTSLFDSFKNKDDELPKDEITSLADTLPLDDNGVISITVPVGMKLLEAEKEEGTIDLFYYIPEEFVEYYVYNDDKKVELVEISQDPRDNENVKYYETANNSAATGYLGIQSDYARFLNEIDRIKGVINEGTQNEYSTTLEHINYEVPNLYYIPNGYELYTENKAFYDEVKLAWIVEAEGSLADGSKIYQIPERCIGSFKAVTEDTYTLLTKGDELKEQMVKMYEIYSQKTGNMGYDYNEETTNRSR